MNKALFLDRDGIINIDHGYVYKQSEFEFMPGIFEICQHAMQKGHMIIVITNQSGIGRGKYNESAFNQLTTWMIAEFAKQQVIITDVYFCPHHPTAGIGHFLTECDCRKPAPGMLFKAAKQHQIDLSQSVFIGDKMSDMQAAYSAGIKQRILCHSDHTGKGGFINSYDNEFGFETIDNISQAKSYIT